MICPHGGGIEQPGDLAGVDVHRYPPPPDPSSKLGFVVEYVYSLMAGAALTAKIALTTGFDAIQACNPPDVYFTLALPFKAAGKKFVFDHHDVVPEFFVSRYGSSSPLVLTVLRALERATFRTADHVISTNESIREVALGRGHRDPATVTVVRNGPVMDRVREGTRREPLKEGYRFLCCWVGVIRGVDDGVDLALHAIHHLVVELGRRDCLFVFLGDGVEAAAMRRLAGELGISDVVRFPGWVPAETVFDHLATADLGLQPNPKTPRIDMSTAIKTMEYMACGLPVVAFDVVETRRSAGDAAAYAQPNDVTSFARAVSGLLDDPGRREAMGAIGRRRVAEELAWDHQKAAYVGVFDRLLGRAAPGRSAA